MELTGWILIGVLTAAVGLCFLRLLRGRSLADRIVALDTMLVTISSGVAVHAATTRDGRFLDVLVVAALIGFTGTAFVARFIEQSSDDG